MGGQRILVLGAGGFIGRRIVAALAASDWAEPVAALRAAAEGPGQQLIVDACSDSSLTATLSGVDAVINSIAGDPATIVANARALMAAAGKQARPPRVVHLSSMAVYGQATGLLDEAASGSMLSAYGAAKLEAEKTLAPYPDLVRLRPGIVYGPRSREWSGLIGEWLLAGRLGVLGAAGEGGCNLVHVDDVAQAAVEAARAPDISGQVFNLSLSQTPTWNEYFSAYARALGRQPAMISTSRLALELKLFGPLLKLGQLARLPVPPPIRPWLIDQCRQDIRLDVRRAETVLGLRWKPLEEGLSETAAWLHSAR